MAVIQSMVNLMSTAGWIKCLGNWHRNTSTQSCLEEEGIETICLSWTFKSTGLLHWWGMHPVAGVPRRPVHVMQALHLGNLLKEGGKEEDESVPFLPP